MSRHTAYLYAIEAEIRGHPAEHRRAVRQERSRPIVVALHGWLQDQVKRVSGPSDLAKAMRYAIRHWPGLVVFLDDGRVENGGKQCVVRSVKTAGPAGTVIERTEGGLGMVLDIAVDGAALVFTSRAFFLAVGRWRVPIPAWLTPGRCRVEHRAVDAERFRFTLTMTHPLWGTTFRQTGLFSTLEALS